MPAPPTDELPRLGRYQVINKIAAGGMAEVFLAKAVGAMGFQRLVAVKLIHANFTRDPEFVKMFIDEARISMNLHHRNIVQVFDLDKTDDTYFIAMEFVHGVNLYDLYERMAQKGRWFEPSTALYIVAEVSKGLHFAHTRRGPDGRPLGIIHRDISPQNVLLSFEGEVKITDFGIATAAERLHQTAAGIVKGKYAYMAPERLQEQPTDGRVDVFSVGVLLYELLVGENPFAGSSAVDTIENVLNKKIPAPSERGAPVSTGLDRITLRALARSPAERYASAQDLADAVTEYALELTQARREMAAGDAALASLLAELFPEKAKRPPGAADPKSFSLPGVGVAVQTVDPAKSKAAPKNGRPEALRPHEGAVAKPAARDPADPSDTDEPTVLRMTPMSDLEALGVPKVAKVGFDDYTTREDLEISDDSLLAQPTLSPGMRRDDLSMPTPVTPMSMADVDKTAPTELPSMNVPLRKPVVSPVAARGTDPSGPPDDMEDSFATTLPSQSGLVTVADDDPAEVPPQVVVPPIVVPQPQPQRGSTSNRDFSRAGLGAAPAQHAPHAQHAAGHGAQPLQPTPLYVPQATSYPPPGTHDHPALVVPVSSPDLQAQQPISYTSMPQPNASSRTTTIIAVLLLVIAALVVLAAVLVVRSRDGGGHVPVPLKITSTPPGATVTIDGKVQKSPTPLDTATLAGEEHTITVSLDGYAAPEPRQVRPLADDGTAAIIHFDLVSVAAEKGALTVVPDPADAQVFIDGQLRGTGQITVSDLPLGKELLVRVEANGVVKERKVTLDREARDVTMPIVLGKPKAATPGPAQPGATQPGATQPGTAQPGTTPQNGATPQGQPQGTAPQTTAPQTGARAGTRRVQLVTEYGSWANVYYNQRWLGTTPLSETLPIGDVPLRVVNETLKLDKVITVKVTAAGPDQITLPLK